ncbi:MAG: TAXI family TRAP transporter solute-binding subunit [Proteobacteria bacterium]|nr:TAXI family TRAP transporter solute-binding subunit [Pseudomonadota bacterium]MBU1744810.1 TAXI family TRAP transporter solute-binding subunit [Pseudomonadota bacterium]MBU1965681.1 TAXI family TRAP transporter solute-binding subunit [Pseudomonadota bacterium]
MKRSMITVLAVLMAASLGFAVQTFAAEKKIFLTLASGSPGGAYYPLGGGMSVIVQKTVEGFRCAAESTGASVENSRLVGNGDSDMGMVMGSVGYNASQGKAPFEKKYDVVALFQMYPAPQHLVTTAQSGIKSIADLKGKKVSIDVPGSGCSTMAKIILEEAGFNLEKDLTIANLSQTESVQALKDGVVDAVFFNFAYPGSAVMDLAATRDIVLVPVDQKLADKIVKKHPYYVKIVIPGKTYSKVDQDVLCLGDSNVMIANKNMKDDVAYKVVKAIYSNVKEGKYALINVHPVAAQLTPQNAVNSPLPLHPGAAKYFKEVGALK